MFLNLFRISTLRFYITFYVGKLMLITFVKVYSTFWTLKLKLWFCFPLLLGSCAEFHLCCVFCKFC